MLKKQMEGELAEAKEALRRSHELNEMLNRRIELLEDTLRRERSDRRSLHRSGGRSQDGAPNQEH